MAEGPKASPNPGLAPPPTPMSVTSVADPFSGPTPSQPLKVGVLFKRSDYLKEWKPRHFAVEPPQFVYSLPESPRRVHKALDLTMCKISRAEGTVTWGQHTLHTFVVAKPGAGVSYTLGALTPRDADEWVHVLKAAAGGATRAFVKALRSDPNRSRSVSSSLAALDDAASVYDDGPPEGSSPAPPPPGATTTPSGQQQPRLAGSGASAEYAAPPPTTPVPTPPPPPPPQERLVSASSSRELPTTTPAPTTLPAATRPSEEPPASASGGGGVAVSEATTTQTTTAAAAAPVPPRQAAPPPPQREQPQPPPAVGSQGRSSGPPPAVSTASNGAARAAATTAPSHPVEPPAVANGLPPAAVARPFAAARFLVPSLCYAVLCAAPEGLRQFRGAVFALALLYVLLTAGQPAAVPALAGMGPAPVVPRGPPGSKEE